MNVEWFVDLNPIVQSLLAALLTWGVMVGFVVMMTLDVALG